MLKTVNVLPVILHCLQISKCSVRGHFSGLQAKQDLCLAINCAKTNLTYRPGFSREVAIVVVDSLHQLCPLCGCQVCIICETL